MENQTPFSMPGGGPKGKLNMRIALLALVVLLALFVAFYMTNMRLNPSPVGDQAPQPAAESAPEGLGATLYEKSNDAQNPFNAETATTANPFASKSANPFKEGYKNPFE